MDDKQRGLKYRRMVHHNCRTGGDLADSHCSTNRFATTQLIMPRHIVESIASAKSLLPSVVECDGQVTIVLE